MKLLSIMEAISEWSGKAVSFLLLALIGVICYEVVARYAFDAPTIWAYESMIYLAGIIYIIGGAYTLRCREHVIVDVLYDRFSPRGKAGLDVFICFLIFLMYVGIMISVGVYFTWGSMARGETSGTLWNPAIYPIKAMIPLGALLMLLQGLVKLTRDIRILITGKDVAGEDVKDLIREEI